MKRLINYRDTRQRNARHETIGYKVYRVAKSHVVFFGLLFALLLTSCQTEKKLAKKYLAERPNIEAAVYFPEKADVKVEYNTQLGKQTEVLNGFNQDLFLDVMYNAYAQGMGDYGVNVYIPEDIDKVPVDLVIFRENTEDLYAGIEFAKGAPKTAELWGKINELTDGRKIATGPDETGISIKPISVSGTERLVKAAFEYARANGRKKVTAVHKANIMKFSDGLFLEVSRAVAERYPDIEFEDRIVDNMCMQLVQKPELYDVVALPNLYGDILSDLCAGLVGGLGVAPGANIGRDAAVFEATHGSAPKYKGLDKVNPTAMILSGMLMLRYLKETEAADRLEAAVAAVIKEGKSVTYDMKADRNDPTAVGTQAMAEAICEKL